MQMQQGEPFHPLALVADSSKALGTGICLKDEWVFGVKLGIG